MFIKKRDVERYYYTRFDDKYNTLFRANSITVDDHGAVTFGHFEE